MIVFYDLPEVCIARIAKNGSCSLAFGMAQSIFTDMPPPDDNHTKWRFLIPTTTIPTKPVLLLVRDPVERFISAVAQLKIKSIGDALDQLLSGELDGDEHFTPQVEYTEHGQENRFYKFPDDMEKLCGDVGIPVYHLNKSEKPKFVPTRGQRREIEYYYDADYKLFEGI